MSSTPRAILQSVGVWSDQFVFGTLREPYKRHPEECVYVELDSQNVDERPAGTFPKKTVIDLDRIVERREKLPFDPRLFGTLEAARRAADAPFSPHEAQEGFVATLSRPAMWQARQTLKLACRWDGGVVQSTGEHLVELFLAGWRVENGLLFMSPNPEDGGYSRNTVGKWGFAFCEFLQSWAGPAR